MMFTATAEQVPLGSHSTSQREYHHTVCFQAMKYKLLIFSKMWGYNIVIPMGYIFLKLSSVNIWKCYIV